MWAWVRIPLLTNVFKYQKTNDCYAQYPHIRGKVGKVRRFEQQDRLLFSVHSEMDIFLKIRTGEPGHRSPYLSHAKRALYHLSQFPFDFGCLQIGGILRVTPISFHSNKINTRLNFLEKKSPGGPGYRSPCLSNANRALYHLSQTPSKNCGNLHKLVWASLSLLS